MDNKKKGSNLFFRILLVLFVAFLCVYSISMNGYLEKVNRDKTLYTEEQISEFESDVENGEYLELKDYILVNEIDYSNKVSDLGEEISELIDYSANKSIDLLNSFFSYLFE